MPYVDSDRRNKLLFGEVDAADFTVGDLNYTLTTAIDMWLKDKGVCYANLNAAIGVLECAKLELYRRVAAPYEDKKLAENGEVYECLKG